MWKLIVLAAALATIAGGVGFNLAQPLAPADQHQGDQQEIETMLRGYEHAFNINDAAAAGKFWAADADYLDRDTGERSVSRDAIQTNLAKLFKQHPGIRLKARLSRVRLVKPNVAKVEGQSILLIPDEEPNESSFWGILIKNADHWEIDSVQESDVPAAPTAYDGLKELEWMVGQWRDASEGVKVETAVRWTMNNSFLLRSYLVQVGENDAIEGTQVIGWDPRTKRIRSWTFSSDGSFGEEAWSKNGDEWLVRMTETREGGDAASATQVIKRIDADTFTVQTIAKDVNGEPAPASQPIKAVRVGSKSAASGERGQP
jgi:uncharacterized protein (TIGR02246 family)